MAKKGGENRQKINRKMTKNRNSEGKSVKMMKNSQKKGHKAKIKKIQGKI